MKKDSSPMKFALPAALVPFVAPLATIAAEGTSRVSEITYFYQFYY